MSGGQMSIGSVGASRKTALSGVFTDTVLRVQVQIPVVATGASIDGLLMARYNDSSDYYYAGARFNTDQSINAVIGKVVGGVGTTLVTTAIPNLSYSASTVVQLRASVVGTALMVRVWLAATEPGAWSATVTDGDLASGLVGCRSLANSGNTNTLPFVMAFDNFAVVNPQTFTITRPVDGSAIAHNATAPVQVSTPMVLTY